MNEKISYNEYITTRFIDRHDKMKANEKKCVICDKYYYIVVRDLCIQHNLYLRIRKLKFRNHIKNKRLQDALLKDLNFLKTTRKVKSNKV